MRIFLFTIFLAICGSSQAESTSFTELVEHTPSEVVTLNLDGRYALSISGEYEYLIDKQDNQFFSSELILFQKSYEETPDLAHILHVQFITLKEEGLKHWPTGAAYLELVKKGTASRRDTFETRKLPRIHVAERKFEGFQYVALINGMTEEGFVYVSKTGSEIVVLRGQEMDKYREHLSSLLSYAKTLNKSQGEDKGLLADQ